MIRRRLLLGLAMALLALPAGAQLVARQITVASASSDLFSGSDAIGGIGDWYLSNGVVEAIVDDVGFQEDILQTTGKHLPIRSYGFSGGTLVDLGLVGHDNDQWISLSQIVNFGAKTPIVYVPAGWLLSRPELPGVLARIDSVAKEASLTILGYVYLSQTSLSDAFVLAVTEYSLRENEDFLRVETLLLNLSPQPIAIVNVSDVSLLATGGLLSYAPVAGWGYQLPELVTVAPFLSFSGRLGPEDGIVDTVAMRASGKASYTIDSSEERLLFVMSRPLFNIVGTLPRPSPLPPAGSLRYRRRILLGDGNDAGSSGEKALRTLGASLGLPSGRVRGRLVVSDGMPFQASIESALVDLEPRSAVAETFLSGITGDQRPEPLLQFAIDSSSDGSFAFDLPVGVHELTVATEERTAPPPVRFAIEAGVVTDLGDIELPSLGKLHYRLVQRGPGAVPLPGKITIKGRNGTADPSMGFPIDIVAEGASQRTATSYKSPAGNAAYTVTGEGELSVHPGDYRVYASRGLEYDYGFADVTVRPAEVTNVSLSLAQVVDTPGWISADFHVHSARSPDSSVPPIDRIHNFAAEGVEVLVASDHNLVFDYQPLIEASGLSGYLTSIAGVEVTTGQNSPNEPNLASLGHWNGWPLEVVPYARKNGAPEEGFVEPNVLFDRLRQRGAEVVQLNHPWWGPLGFFSRIGFDPALALTDGPNQYLLRSAITGTGTRNLDFDTMEIYNGAGPFQAYLDSRASWFSLLLQGELKTATAVTDTHHVIIQHAGFPRTYVRSDAAMPRDLDVSAFDENLKAMRAFGTSGPFVEVSLETGAGIAGMGDTVSLSSGPATLHVRVRAACWIPVEELRVYVNGSLVTTTPLTHSCPSSVLRYDGSIELAPSEDSFIVVEAGQTIPSAISSLEAGESVFSILEPKTLSLAFTNPIFLDVDGNGRYDAPGVAGAGQLPGER